MTNKDYKINRLNQLLLMKEENLLLNHDPGRDKGLNKKIAGARKAVKYFDN